MGTSFPYGPGLPFLQTLELPLRGPAPSPLAMLGRYWGDTPDHTQVRPMKQRSRVGAACPSLLALYTGTGAVVQAHRLPSWMKASMGHHLPLPHALLKQLPNISLSGEPEHLPGLRAHSPGQGMRWVGAACLAFHAESKAGCAVAIKMRVGVEVREGVSI